MVLKHRLRINFMNIKLKIKIIGGFSVKLAIPRKSKNKRVLIISIKLRKILQIRIKIFFGKKHK